MACCRPHQVPVVPDTRAGSALNPQTVENPAQVRAILASVIPLRPELTAFFGCLYYAALRPEEAVALRHGDLVLPPNGWGKLILITACPRTGAAWTAAGTSHELRGLKHRPGGAHRIVPIPPLLVALLRWHLDNYGTTPDGRLFRGTRSGMLSESLYGRTWHAARTAALGPALAATGLARRPYDLRHAALSLWLDASSAPRPGRRPRGEQRPRPAGHLHPLRRRARGYRQPPDRASPRPGTPATLRHSKRFAAPPSPPQTCPSYVREWPTPGGAAPATRHDQSNIHSPPRSTSMQVRERIR